MNILTIDNILIILGQYISIRDIVQLSWTCKKLNDQIFHNEKIWQQRNFIFQPQDQYYLLHQPLALPQLLTKLPRYHHLKQLILHDHYPIQHIFYILDHYAHCVEDIQFNFHQDNHFQQFYQHLESFLFHLNSLQTYHQIPLSFQQYALYLDEYYQHYKNQKQQINLNQPPPLLDDPPFESLTSFHFHFHFQEKGAIEKNKSKVKKIISFLSRNQQELKITLASSSPSPPQINQTIKRKNNNNQNTNNNKRKKQQTEEKKEEQYYKRIHYLSHQLLEKKRKQQQQCHSTFLSSSSNHHPHHHHQHSVNTTNTTIPIIHVMRYKKN